MKATKNKIIILVIVISLVMCAFSVFSFSTSKYTTQTKSEYKLNLLVFDPDYKCISDGENNASIALTNLYPGMQVDYYFSVINNKSNISGLILPVQYSLNLVTYGNLPLQINIYKGDQKIDNLCHDHRTNQNYLQTFSSQRMGSSDSSITDSYRLEIVWDPSYAYYEFSYEVEYLTIFCSAWQNDFTY